MNDAVPPSFPPDSITAPTLPLNSQRPAWWTPLPTGIAYLLFWQVAPRISLNSSTGYLFWGLMAVLLVCFAMAEFRILSKPKPTLSKISLSFLLLAAAVIVFAGAPRLNEPTMAFLVSTIFSLALVIVFTAQMASILAKPSTLFANLLLAAVCVVPLRVMIGLRHPITPWVLLLHVPGLPDLLFIWLAASFGGLLSRLLRAINMIPPIAVVLVLVDIWTVLLGGPVQHIMESKAPRARAVANAMTVMLPAPQSGTSPIPVGQVVGFADFLFIAFFVSAIRRFVPEQSAYGKTVYTLVGVLCLYMLIVFFAEMSLPALVPMGVAMIMLHWNRFRYEPSEAFALLYAALIIALLVAAFWWMSNRQSENKQLGCTGLSRRSLAIEPRLAGDLRCL